MSDMSIQQVLNQMRILQGKAAGESVAVSENTGANFAQTLKSSLDKVNDLQNTAGELKTAFELGDPKVSLVETMIASQKANIAFQATVQVRNKFIEAYKEIMNMPL